MNEHNLPTHLLIAAGCVHFLILIASAVTPRFLRWQESMATLPPFLRQLFWVYGAFIVMMIVGLGTLTLCFAPQMARGEPVARGVCAYTAIFWGVRLLVQWFVFDARPYLTSTVLKLGYHLLTAAFVMLTVVYTSAALRTFPFNQ